MIYRLGSLGDTVVALPCFHKIVEHFPNARRTVLTNVPVSSKAAPLESILRNGEFLHGTITYPVMTRSPRELLRVFRELRALKAKTLVYMGGGRGVLSVYRDMLFFLACGFTRIIGAPITQDLDQGRVEPGGGEEPEVERLIRCFAELGPIDPHQRGAWDLRLTETELDRADAFLSPLAGAPFLAINTGGKIANKDWGEANWATLLPRLADLGVPALVFVGAAEDSERAQRLGALWPGQVLDGCGKLSPRESAGVLRRAALFVGHDSGPLHLAAAVGVTCVGLFGANNRPRKWHPYGAQHRVLHDVNGVERIAPDAVEREVRAALAGAPAPQGDPDS